MQHRFVNYVLSLADYAEHLYDKNFEALIKKQPILGYSGVKHNFASMHLTGWTYMLSLCLYYNLC